MHPIPHGIFSCSSFCLRDLALMMRELQIHTTTMYVESFAEIFCAHHGTFNMPSGKAVSPGRRPTHNVSRRGLLPKCKVDLVSLLVLAVELTTTFKKLLDVAS